jgi:hypothetical protein
MGKHSARHGAEMKPHVDEHLDPFAVLGVSENATPAAAYAAYTELSAACSQSPEQLSLLKWAFEQVSRSTTQKSVTSPSDAGSDPMESQDGIVSGRLIPNFAEACNEPIDEPLNIIELPARPGASAAADAEKRELLRKADQASPQIAAWDDTVPNNPVAGMTMMGAVPVGGHPSDLECLLGMSEFEDHASLAGEDDESVLEQLIMRDEYTALLKPKLRRSLIGEGEKEIVSTRAAATRNSQVVQSVDSLLASGPEVSGQLLKTIRELHGVELVEVSARTKVHIRHLIALEEDQLNQLPALVYFRGFVDSYLKYFGINSPSLVNRFIERYLQARNGRGR